MNTLITITIFFNDLLNSKIEKVKRASKHFYFILNKHIINVFLIYFIFNNFYIKQSYDFYFISNRDCFIFCF